MSLIDDLDVVQRLLADRPSFHLGGQAHWYSLPETLQAISEAVRPGDSTVETGAGASTVVFAARGANHTVISPDGEEHRRIREYCLQIGVDTSGVAFIEGPSDDILPSHLGRDRSLDVAFIDGAHLFPFPEVDWHYISRSLKVGGKLFMDDIPIPAVAPLFRHMAREPSWQVDRVFDDRAAAFTLLAVPECEEWLRQPFNRGYPDYGFVELPKRIGLVGRHRLEQLREGASRYPILRRAYKRAMQFNDRSNGR
jgi:predicted O-methyltransferase YrrM